LLTRGSFDPLFNELSANIDEPAIFNTAGASGLAIATREATIEMKLRAAGDFATLKHLLDEVNASPRPIQLVSEELVRWAGGIAETTMHAFAHDRLGLLGVGCPFELRTQVRLHWRSLQISIETATIEYPVRIESILQSSVNTHQGFGHRCERALSFVSGAHQGGVSTDAGCSVTHLLRLTPCPPPALGAAPFDELTSWQFETRCGRWDGQAPQTLASSEVRIGEAEECMGMIAHAKPPGCCFFRWELKAT